MGRSNPETVTIHRRALSQAFLLLAGVGVPCLVSLIVVTLTTRFAYPFLFLYMPGLFLVSYFGGLWPGIVSVAASTILAGSPSGVPSLAAVTTLRQDALPSLIFLFSGALIALAGIQTSRYHLRLREDLAKSRRQERHEAFLAQILSLRARFPDRQSFSTAMCDTLLDLPADAVGLLLFQPRAPVLEPAAFRSSDEGGRERLASAFADVARERGGPLLRRMFVAAEPLMSLRADQAPPEAPEGGRAWIEWLTRERFDAALFLPLLVGDDQLGMLALFARRPLKWEDETRMVARSAADRVALELQRIRAREQRLQRERHAAFLADLMLALATQRDVSAQLDILASRCAELFASWCAISLVGTENRVLRANTTFHHAPASALGLRGAFEAARFGADHPFEAALFEARRPRLITGENPDVDDVRASLPVAEALLGPLGMKAILVVPIYAGEDPLGILWLLSESVREWDDDEQRLSSLIAERAGQVIVNARLAESERKAVEDAEREARRVNAVARVISIAASALDPGAAFDEFAEALQLLLPFDRIAVTLQAEDRDRLATRYAKGAGAGGAADAVEGPKTSTAHGWVIDRQQAFIRKDTLESHEFTEDAALEAAGIRSYAVVPMSVGGKVVGTLDLGHHEPGFYSASHVKLVKPIADQLAITISRFQLLDQTKRRVGQLSEMLQRALLPEDLPKAPFISLAATYQPADPDVKIGGDWYDAILFADDHLLVSIGDVAGHGMAAATVMGQVRHIVRAYAMEGQTPGRILTSLNRLLCSVAGSLQVSLWVATLDPLTGSVVYGGAGHPPAVALADGQVRQLLSTGPPLGVSLTVRYGETPMSLPPGSRLVAYTDGLIEATRDVVVGERRLLEAVRATQHNPPDRAVDTLVARALDGAMPDDDVAVLIVDILPVDSPVSVTLPAAPENLSRVRRLTRTYARRLGMPEHRVEEMVMAVGEAALNVVEHAYRGIRGNILVRGELTGSAVTVTVKDFGQWRDQVERGRGRGTRIMQGFSDGLKTSTTPAGTTVQLTWATNRPVPPRLSG
jgi:serine phosphatase RsbU (regulator of sigma subunit)/anti-sigma regulatory factor (Ser/Thr protein kinase)/GTP-sensing pleiotropic transcriptional regulator CodY